ncbi:MAG: tetratricopeptide repeat protein [Spirochaetales bacterium]|nr:tetratricopeptide repeat protein [Spirochaetales bacterium]
MADEAEALRLEGVKFSEANEYDKAIEAYTQAIALKPDFARAYYNRGNAYSYKKDYGKAIENYNEAIRICPAAGQLPNEGVYYCGRGNSFYSIDQYDKALEDYDRAIKLKPGEKLYADNRANAVKKKKEKAAGGRKTETVGTLRKNCPSCGAAIESFQTRCPSCGHELNAQEVSGKFTQFVKRLEELRSGYTSFTHRFNKEDTRKIKILVPEGRMVKEDTKLIKYSGPVYSGGPVRDQYIDAPANGKVHYFVKDGQEFDADTEIKMGNVYGPIGHDRVSYKGKGGKYEYFESYEWNSADDWQMSFIENFILPNTKEDLLEFLIFFIGKVVANPKTLYDQVWNDIWKNKCKQVYAKARLCLKTDQGTLRSIEEILKENSIA